MKKRVLVIVLVCLVARCASLNAQWVHNAQSFGGQVHAFASIGTNLFAAVYGNGVFRSTDNGITWTPVDSNLTSNDVWCLATNGTDLFAGTRNVYHSSNSGATWMVDSAGIPDEFVNTFAIVGSDIFAGTDHGVFRSTIDGNGWTDDNAGLSGYPLNNVDAIIAFGGYIFAGTNIGVYRRPLSEVTSVETPRAAIPATYTLEQNYPNPFNPSTTIAFSLPRPGYVTLKMFDVLGREVATLVNETKAPGSYTVRLNASQLASGVYFYRLQTRSAEGGQTEAFDATRKLLLVK